MPGPLAFNGQATGLSKRNATSKDRNLRQAVRTSSLILPMCRLKVRSGSNQHVGASFVIRCFPGLGTLRPDR